MTENIQNCLGAVDKRRPKIRGGLDGILDTTTICMEICTGEKKKCGVKNRKNLRRHKRTTPKMMIENKFIEKRWKIPHKMMRG